MPPNDGYDACQKAGCVKRLRRTITYKNSFESYAFPTKQNVFNW